MSTDTRISYENYWSRFTEHVWDNNGCRNDSFDVGRIDTHLWRTIFQMRHFLSVEPSGTTPGAANGRRKNRNKKRPTTAANYTDTLFFSLEKRHYHVLGESVVNAFIAAVQFPIRRTTQFIYLGDDSGGVSRWRAATVRARFVLLRRRRRHGETRKRDMCVILLLY